MLRIRIGLRMRIEGNFEDLGLRGRV